MNRDHREIFAIILIVIIFILLAIATKSTSGFWGIIIGFLGAAFVLGGAYYIYYCIVEEPENVENRIRKEYEEKAKQNITKNKNN